LSELPLEKDSSKIASLEEEVPKLPDCLLLNPAWEQHMHFHRHLAYDGRSYALPLFNAKNLSLREEVGLLGTGTERRLLARRLEAVGLEDALEGLGRGSLAGAATTGASSRGGHYRGSGVSGRCRHFVYWLRQTFRMNAG